MLSTDLLRNEKNLFYMKEEPALDTADGVGSTNSCSLSESSLNDAVVRSQIIEMDLSLLDVSTTPHQDHTKMIQPLF